MLADTADPVVAVFVVGYDEAVETLGECTPTTRGALHERFSPLGAESAVALAD